MVSRCWSPDGTFPSLCLHDLHAEFGGSRLRPLAEREALACLQQREVVIHSAAGLEESSTHIRLNGECLQVQIGSGETVAKLPLLSFEFSQVTDRVYGYVLLMARSSRAEHIDDPCVWLFAVLGSRVMEPMECQAEVCCALRTLSAYGATCTSSSMGSLVIVGEQPLGVGSFAEVWLAEASDEREVDSRRTHHGCARARKVAAKIFKHDPQRAHWCSTVATPAALKHEVEFLVAVQGHQNIIRFGRMFRLRSDEVPATVSEASIAVSLWCLTMEFCAGGNLREAIRKRKLDEPDAKKMMTGILRGLAHVHACGVLHRDVKPENIMLRTDGTPVLTDFGLSCWADDEAERMSLCGSPGFIPPEVILGQGWYEKSDVFSAGALLYFALSGKRLFQGQDCSDTLSQTMNCRLTSNACSRLDHASRRCTAFVLALLRKKVHPRPLAGEALQDAWFSDQKPAQYPSKSLLKLLPNGSSFSNRSEVRSAHRQHQHTKLGTIKKPRLIPWLFPCRSKMSSVVPHPQSATLASFRPQSSSGWGDNSTHDALPSRLTGSSLSFHGHFLSRSPDDVDIDARLGERHHREEVACTKPAANTSGLQAKLRDWPWRSLSTLRPRRALP
mmetsp:Transcript_136559/g.345805  ORF Transcript_136559/g.345805 Transcript_136559/m.345805 type:complete len:615 (-) Transcript_136559:215-2059(-)